MAETENTTYRILAFNFGSTSTKVGVFQDDEKLYAGAVRYEAADFAGFETVFDQADLRERDVVRLVDEAGFALDGFDVVVTRGPLCKPLDAGTYEVCGTMEQDGCSLGGHHPVALGPIVARRLSSQLGVEAYTVDPPVVDQMEDVARISGLPEVERTPAWQPLNHRQIARAWAADHDKGLEECNLVVAQMGGGTSISAMRRGRAIDVNNGTEGEGAMTPERPGTVPLCPVIEMCFSGEYTKEQILRKVRHGAGVLGYLGTSDMCEVERRVKAGDERAKLVLDALCYQVAKEIGAMYAALRCDCNAILLTGGLAYSDYVCDSIARYVGDMAPVCAYPGEDELSALAQGALRVLRGEEPLLHYAH